LTQLLHDDDGGDTTTKPAAAAMDLSNNESTKAKNSTYCNIEGIFRDDSNMLCFDWRSMMIEQGEILFYEFQKVGHQRYLSKDLK
jgi:hypothetical protein